MIFRKWVFELIRLLCIFEGRVKQVKATQCIGYINLSSDISE